jgi:hypothetical protein
MEIIINYVKFQLFIIKKKKNKYIYILILYLNYINCFFKFSIIKYLNLFFILILF